MKYNPINSIFHEGNVTLLVVESEDNGATCKGCWYNGRKGNKQNYTQACFYHQHTCTASIRKDGKFVIFKEVKQ